MNYAQAAAKIVSLLKRPDRLASIKENINDAISFMAASGTFRADHVELTLPITANIYAQSFPINADPFIRFRKINYIRPSAASYYVTPLDPKQIFSDGCEQVNRYYRSGNNIVLKLSALAENLEIGYYQYHAPLVNNEDTDWMLDEMWPAVRFIALSYSYRDIGETSEADRNFALGMDMYRVFQRDLADGVSYG